MGSEMCIRDRAKANWPNEVEHRGVELMWRDVKKFLVDLSFEQLRRTKHD